MTARRAGRSRLVPGARRPGRALLLAVLAVPLAAAVRGAPPDPELVQRIDRFVERERAASAIPGIAVALVGPDHVTVRTFGQRGDGQPVMADTPFPIGSLTKSFTAVLVRQLVAEGRLRPEDPVQRYLPWLTLAGPGAGEALKIQHLLNQTSGFSRADGLVPVLEGPAWTAARLRSHLSGVRLTAPPGSRYEYSNLNYLLLGAVVEAVTGQTWEHAVRERVLQPLGMVHTHTGWAPARAGTDPDAEAGANRMSDVHRYWFGRPVPQAEDIAPALAPTGALVASAGDMGRYLQWMLRGVAGPSPGGVLPVPQRHALLQPGSPPAQSTLLGQRFDFRYAEGWFAGPFARAEDARWHLGNLASFAAWMVLLPQQHTAVVVLINANSELPFFGADTAFSRIPAGVVNLVLGQAPPEGPSVASAYRRIDALLIAALTMAGVLVVWALRLRSLALSAVLGVVALLGAAGVAAGPGWPTLAAFAPDVTLALALIAALLALALPARLLVRLAFRKGPRPAAVARPEATAPGTSPR